MVVQNVTTYATVIDVPNPELKLKPGMTANVHVEIARRSDVLRVPNAALRFRPTAEMFAALNQTPPPDAQSGGRRGRGRGGGRRPAARSRQPTAPAARQRAASGAGAGSAAGSGASGAAARRAAAAAPRPARRR